MSIARLEHEIVSPDGRAEGSRRLRVLHAREQIDLPAAERAVRDLLLALGRDPSSPHLAETPRRAARLPRIATLRNAKPSNGVVIALATSVPSPLTW